MAIEYRHLLAAAILVVFAPSASAEDPVALIRIVPNRDLMLVIGHLNHGFADQLAQELDRNHAVKVIEIESSGGISSEAHNAARLLNQRQITIRVRGRCSSACALLWAGTDRREILGKGQLGLHNTRPGKRPPKLLEQVIRARNERMYVEPLKHAGFSDSMIARARATPPESMLWLSAADLKRDGVRFKLVQVAPRPST